MKVETESIESEKSAALAGRLHRFVSNLCLAGITDRTTLNHKGVESLKR